ncbi:MAG: hypothetical protein HQM08_09610 [Candidatus Riflebacteria bacterium]|nr:hypothetical protein [Candidatus Riflebacteria bacterium]
MFLFELADLYGKESLKALQKTQSMIEEQLTKTLDEMAKTQGFCVAMGKTLESSLDVRQAFNGSLKRWAEFFQIVTKKDVQEAGKQLYDGNYRLETISAEVSDIKKLVQTQNEYLKKLSEEKKKMTYGATRRNRHAEKVAVSPN